MSSNELFTKYEGYLVVKETKLVNLENYICRWLNSEVSTTLEELEELIKNTDKDIEKLDNAMGNVLIEYKNYIRKNVREKHKLVLNTDNIVVVPNDISSIEGTYQSEATGIYLSGRNNNPEKALEERKVLIHNLTGKVLRKEITLQKAKELMKEIDQVYGIMHKETMNDSLLDMLNDLDFDNKKEL